MKRKKIKYDCLKCTGYCCSYDRIEVSEKDVKRLAKYFGMTEQDVKSKHTKTYKLKENEEVTLEQILRHKKDHIFTSVCKFLDSDSRQCTIYEARPKVCRQYPNTTRCGYYEFLKFERKQQDDKSYYPTF